MHASLKLELMIIMLNDKTKIKWCVFSFPVIYKNEINHKLWIITPIFLDGHACGKSGNGFSYLCERTLKYST